MLIFNEIADIVLISGTLLVVWELVKAAKIVSAPPQDEARSVLVAVKRLHALIEKMNSRLGGVVEPHGSRSSFDDDVEEENGQEMGR